MFMNVPGAQPSGSPVPGGQKRPTGHANPTGFGTVALEGQKNPAAHAPVGAVRPSVAQYAPGEHGRHCDCMRSPVVGEYVPTGHLVGAKVPLPQNEPAGHGEAAGVGVDCPPVHTKPA